MASIANGVGKVLRVDMKRLVSSDHGEARALVEIKANKKPVNVVWVNLPDKELPVKIRYEYSPSRCCRCVGFDHDDLNYPSRQQHSVDKDGFQVVKGKQWRPKKGATNEEKVKEKTPASKETSKKDTALSTTSGLSNILKTPIILRRANMNDKNSGGAGVLKILDSANHFEALAEYDEGKEEGEISVQLKKNRILGDISPAQNVDTPRALRSKRS